MKSFYAELPAHWASYIMNADSSSLTEAEVVEIDLALEHELDTSVTISNCMHCDEAGIGYYKGVQCELATYFFDPR